MSDVQASNNISVDDVPLPDAVRKKLKEQGYSDLQSFQGIHFPDVYKFLTFDGAKALLKELLTRGIDVRFSSPDWNEEEWYTFVNGMVSRNLVSWKEVAMAVCGELNPPQVGTAIASNASFQAKFPPRETMRNVMAWFYAQSGRCVSCGTRLFLEADHVRPKQAFLEAGEDVAEADRLENLQLLCKRCNVIKRPSHALGGISFAPAQSVLIWIILHHMPATRDEFYKLCREYGLTMANIRFDEAWAFVEWLKKDGQYEPIL